MSIISAHKTFSSGEVLTASDLNSSFSTIINDYNGSITNANIGASAAISLSKLASTPATLTGTEILTNKTLTSPVITSPAIARLNLVLIPAQGFTTGSDSAYWSPSYGQTITFQALTTGTKMGRALHPILPADIDLAQDIVFKINGEGASSLTVTPTVIIGFLRSGTINTITGYNNNDMATQSWTTTVTTFTLATIAGSNWNAGDMLVFGVGLKSSSNIHLRSVWIEYTRKLTY